MGIPITSCLLASLFLSFAAAIPAGPPVPPVPSAIIASLASANQPYSASCPTKEPTWPTVIPGCFGAPECIEYSLVASQRPRLSSTKILLTLLRPLIQGLGADKPNFCLCEGLTAPLTTRIVSGTTIADCHYSTQPLSNIPLETGASNPASTSQGRYKSTSGTARATSSTSRTRSSSSSIPTSKPASSSSAPPTKITTSSTPPAVVTPAFTPTWSVGPKETPNAAGDAWIGCEPAPAVSKPLTDAVAKFCKSDYTIFYSDVTKYKQNGFTFDVEYSSGKGCPGIMALSSSISQRCVLYISFLLSFFYAEESC